MQGLGEESEEVDFYEGGYESVNLVGWCFVVWDVMLVRFIYVVVCRNATIRLRLHGGEPQQQQSRGIVMSQL